MLPRRISQPHGQLAPVLSPPACRQAEPSRIPPRPAPPRSPSPHGRRLGVQMRHWTLQPGERGIHMGGRPVGHPGCEEGAQESLWGVTRPEEGHVGLSAAGADAAGGGA